MPGGIQKAPDGVAARITVHGTVQGVGFRPFVYRLARSLGLRGRAFNAPAGLVLEVAGSQEALDELENRLGAEGPPQAVVQRVDVQTLTDGDWSDFQLVASASDGQGQDQGQGQGQGQGLVPPDIATCHRCLAETADPRDRRHGYPFTNCTDCGPRYTIVQRLPYDRATTTMAGFTLCDPCAAEYADPHNRRFHAQPNACPDCGPRVWLSDPDGAPMEVDDPLDETRRLLGQGRIGALQSLGGFHLVCDATRADVVARLRRRKNRPHKPFAIMARDLEVIRRLARVSDAEATLLEGWRRPIVLLRPRSGEVPEEVSGASGWLGVMLPYTPLHRLLFAGPCDTLVMTSGNHQGAPLAHTHEDARSKLGVLADFFLLHDRPIHRRADDSVVRCTDHGPVILRRSRGWAGAPVILPHSGPDQLALGGDLKATCTVTRRDQAMVSQHVGDLAHPEVQSLLEATAADLQALLSTHPARVIHDAHPDYHSTRLARSLAATLDCPRLAVQHHHAHALACLADNGWEGPALAVVLDGAGYGPDQTVWGGEVLAVDGLTFQRLAHLVPLPLAGGDRAATEPWRMAAAALYRRDPHSATKNLRRLVPEALISDPVLHGVVSLCEGERAIRTSSAGRLFDAAASLLGLCHLSTFEGQAAMGLEHAAGQSDTQEVSRYHLDRTDDHAPWRVDLLPTLATLATLAEEGDGPRGARIFHNTLVEAFAEATARARDRSGVNTVALSGGVLQNRLVHDGLVKQLTARGLKVLVHRQVPPNDGGLSLGQAWAGVLADTPGP
jgi:hydrogenase maturation protein HypF